VKENNPQKIVYIVPSLDAGGAERFILDLIRNLNRNLFSPTLVLFSHGGFFETEAQKLGIDLIVLRKRFKFDPINFWKLYQTVKRLKPSIVHTQLGGDIYGRLVARLLKVPVIVSTEQNVQVGEPYLVRCLKTWTAKFAAKIIAVSQAVKIDAKKRYGLPETKLAVIYNGLEVAKFLTTKKPIKNDKVIFGSVGRLTRQKNYSLLLEALAELKDYRWEFRLAGEGELQSSLEQRIKELDLSDRIKLVGLQSDVKSFLADLDVFVLPSLWEGLGIVLLEAGLVGLPVLASRVDGISEVIKDGQTGILFNSNDRPDLVLKLRHILENSTKPELLALGKNLQSNIQTKFDIKLIAGQYQNLYLKLLDK